MSAPSIANKIIVPSTGLHWVGVGLNQAALWLMAPLHKSSEAVIHALATPIRPGEFGNCESKICEWARRFFGVLAALVVSPVALGLACLGFGLDFVGDYLTGKSYTYLAGCAQEKPEDASDYTFLTLNACMFWGGLPILFGGVRPASERIDLLANLVQEHSPDVIAMQEVSYGSALELHARLKNQYAHFFTRIGPNVGKMESCLFVASKYPICSEPEFQPFPNQNGIKRGVFAIETPAFWVLATHLDAGSSTVRKEQLAQVSQFIQELKMRANKPCFLLGDLNIECTGLPNDEYTSSGIAVSYINPRALELNDATATCTNLLTAQALGQAAPEKAYENIDYALLDTASKELFQPRTELIDTFPQALSDHRALLLHATPARSADETLHSAFGL